MTVNVIIAVYDKSLVYECNKREDFIYDIYFRYWRWMNE